MVTAALTSPASILGAHGRGGPVATYGTAGADVRVMRGSLTCAWRSRAPRAARDTGVAHLLRVKPGSLPSDALAARRPAGQRATLCRPPTALRDARRSNVLCSERGLVALHVKAYPPVSMVATFRRATGKAAGRR